MCTRIFGTTILVKNLHVGTKGMNIHDLFTVAVLKSDVIVGHIPRAISVACYVFLGRATRQAGSTKQLQRLSLLICSSPSFLLKWVKIR